MKKNVLIPALCVFTLVGGLLAWKSLIGAKPLKGLRAEEVASAAVELYPPNVTLSLPQEDIAHLISILNKVSIYQRDDSYGEYDGQAVIFTLTKTDGTQLRVQAYNPFIVIDGVGYRTKYEPCEELNQLGNDKLRELSWEEQQALLQRG